MPHSPSVPLYAAADTTVVQRFDIPAKPLADALADFARQAGVLISVERELLTDLRSGAVSGRFTSAEALRRLLSGTSLSGTFADASTVVVGVTGSTTGAYPLRPVVVTGSARTAGYARGRTSSSTRTDTPLRDTPQSVTLVTSELIADQAMQSMTDVVRYVPGVTMGLGEGHRDQPTIRGVNSTSDFFVDGVRDDAQYSRDLYNVDRVEVLKGPNAMIFGRGGGGGVINRVLKQPEWAPTRSFLFEGGAFDHSRAMLDVGQGFGQLLAARLTGVAERSGGFRDQARVSRRGINPTAAFALGSRTTLRLGYEDFRDERFVDRGIPAFEGGPSMGDISTFFGNPDVNEARADVRQGSVVLDHATVGGFAVRSRTQLADYDKFYQNTLPASLNAAGTEVTLTAYNSSMRRHNAFNQTDVTYSTSTGPVHHVLLFGAELGRQRTSVLRNTGFFNNTSTSATAPFSEPTVSTPVTFRQSASDPNGRTVVTTSAFYVQDQIALSSRVQAIVGVRHDRFAIRFSNNRNGEELRRDDNLISPRAGLILKPVAPVSLYASYSLSHLPSAGEQFTGLSVTTQALEPERFVNREVGIKWDVQPELALTAALYRLDNTNAAARHPTDPTRLVQTGHQRTRGVEVGFSGRVTSAWNIAGGYAAQNARVVSATSGAVAGATLPLVPARTFSLWNRYALAHGLGFGLGVVHQSEMYAAIDNNVRLPAFTRVDAAVYMPVARGMRAQLNVENLFDERYYPTSHGNNNIIPGAPRTLRASIRAAF
jgi:catecholate siderophore receptor